MPEDEISPANGPDGPVGAIGRLLARLVLVAFFSAVAIFNTKDTAWPAVSWPMFSQRTTPYPVNLYERNVVRALDEHGQEMWIRPRDLWGMDRYHVGLRQISGSIDQNDPRVSKHRRGLIDCVRMKYPEFDTRRIEIWKLTWTLDFEADQPLEFTHPHESLLLASFGESGDIGVTSDAVTP